ncbi:MAG: deoxyribose-phosphate aldolase [Lentisphaerota bacterium]
MNNPPPTLHELRKMIDHSLLHPTMTDKDILNGCELAKEYDVATVCIKPYSVKMAVELLKGSDVKVCSVIGFPHGNNSIAIKVAETIETASSGATEIDMVVNIGKVLGGDWKYVHHEMKAINDATISKCAILKVIFETDYLKDEHIIKLCEISSEVGVAFVKTSTGYGFVKQSNGFYSYLGATDHNLLLMRKHSSASIQIKAAGGIRTLDDLLRVRALGVTRIGATATKEIITEAIKRNIQ